MIKKMLAMLVAISCAVGAWADATHLSGTDFSGLSAGPFVLDRDDSGQATDSTFWYNGDDSDFEGKIVTDGLANYLDFESNITNPLYRTISDSYGVESPTNFVTTPIGSGLFIDTHVQFTPYLVNENHPAPEAVTTDDKLIVWVRETEVDGGPNVTNLIVTAGYFDDGGNVSASNYVATLSSAYVSDLCSDACRLTIKSYENVTRQSGAYVMGFVVYIDEVAIGYEGDAFDDDCVLITAGLKTNPAQYYTQGGATNKLFLSLLPAASSSANSKLSGVGYAGMGKIGDVYFDDYDHIVPDFAKDARAFTVEMGDGVESFMYNNVPYNTSTNLTAPSTVASVTISNVTYLSGWKHKDDTWRNGNDQVVSNRVGAAGDYGTFYFADGDVFTLVGFQPNYQVVVDGVTNEYQTLYGTGGALAAALSAGNLILNRDIVISEGSGDSAGCLLLEEGTLTIDLNGHTIKGTGVATIMNLAGTLTINDSSAGQTGKVLNSDLGMCMWVAGGTATLNAGTFESIVADVAIVINGGTYLDDAHTPDADDFYLKAYTGGKEITWDQVGGHYYATVGGSGPVVVPCTVTFTTNHVDATSVIVNSGAALGAENIPAFTGGSWDAPAPTAETIVNSDTNFNYTIPYTLTYVTAHGVTPDGATYTNGAPNFALAAAPTADGWTFGGWLIGSDVFEAGDTYVVADHLANTTATAVWTPVTYTLTYTTEHGDAPAAVSYTVESNNFALAAAPDPGVVSVEFVGWVIGVTTNNAGATYVVADHLANTTATAAWAALVPPAKFPQSDTAGTEYAGRTGTPASPFVIRNYDDLVLLKNAVADGEITTQSFEVVSNITGVTAWVGIGTESAKFAGTLNGNGKTIDITFAAGKYNGLFCYINNATISNLTVNVTGVTVSDKTGGAAFVGNAYGVNVLTAIKATGSLGTAVNRITHNAGGLVAYAIGPSASITYNSCTNAMDVYSTYTKLGGFLGWTSGGVTVTINNGVNLGNLDSNSTDSSGNNGTGGLIGWDGTGAAVTINGATSLGTVEMGTGNAGSFYGSRSSDVTFTGVLKGHASEMPIGGLLPEYQLHSLDWATVSGDIATFVTPVATVTDVVSYKAMQPVSTAFTLAAAAASLTIDSSLVAYTGTVSVDSTLSEDYNLRETAIANGTIYSLVSKTPTDPWEPTDHSDAAVSNMVASIFGDAVAAKIHDYDSYTNMVQYLKAKGATVPDDFKSGGTYETAAPYVYQSYILGADALFTDVPKVTVTDVAANATTAGKWDFTVKVSQGASATALAVDKDKLAALALISGSLSPATWVAPTAGNISAKGDDTTHLVTVTINYGEAASGFMKVSE